MMGVDLFDRKVGGVDPKPLNLKSLAPKPYTPTPYRVSRVRSLVDWED